jgi:hypothetical protein
VELAFGASAIPIAVSANDPQYELLPSNVAKTVYLPSVVGVHKMLNNPWLSFVTVPMSITLNNKGATYYLT